MELEIGESFQKGIEAHKKNDLEKAERLYRTVLAAEPNHPDANHNLGLIAVSVNKSKLALPLFRSALAAYRKVEQFWLSYIQGLINENQFETAKVTLEQGKKRVWKYRKTQRNRSKNTFGRRKNMPTSIISSKFG